MVMLVCLRFVGSFAACLFVLIYLVGYLLLFCLLLVCVCCQGCFVVWFWAIWCLAAWLVAAIALVLWFEFGLLLVLVGDWFALSCWFGA